MFTHHMIIRRSLCAIISLMLSASTVWAQQSAAGTLRGQISDEFGGVIGGATATIIDSRGIEKTVTTNEQGIYVVGDLAPGKYVVRVTAEGFARYENLNLVIRVGGRETLNIRLSATIAEEKVNVSTNEPSLNTDPENNRAAVVLKGRDLEALPDDPDDLAATLRAMAGPSAGPNGGQFYIDGFSGGRLPSKDAILEIRINQNPFAAENDRIGFGRIDVITRAGAEKYHGALYSQYSHDKLNARNPFSPNEPRFRFRVYGGNLNGPVIAKRSSFFVNVFRRELDDNAIVNATILDPALNVITFNQAVVTPRRFLDINPRFDYRVSKNNLITARYNYSNFSLKNMGVGEFSLPSQASNMSGSDHTAQITETIIFNPRLVNDIRFQFIRSNRRQIGDNSVPTVVVQDAFTGGGARIGLVSTDTDRWELQDYANWALGKHIFKFGGRFRAVRLSDASTTNFGGTYTFLGGIGPVLDENNQVVHDAGGPVLTTLTSIERYRRTLLFKEQGLSAVEIHALGGEPTFLNIAGGNPLVKTTRVDFGVFLQDDWRIRPGLTLSYGLRYEIQNNIGARRDFAPRIAFVWAPRVSSSQSPKTVIRGGTGIFYERFSESLTLQAERFNGLNQRQFQVSNPIVLDLFPQVPPLDLLADFEVPMNIIRVADDLTSPTTILSSISVERSLPHRITLTTTYLNARGLHYLRSRNINAPLPGTFNPNLPSSGVRPLGDVGNIFEYESSASFKQHQLVINATNQLNSKFTLFATYALGKAESDSDGVGTFPASSFDLTNESGRSALDVRHRAFVGGTISLPFEVSLNPLLIVSSGAPFNITTGIDRNLDTVAAERPAFATDLSRDSVKVTRFGSFDLDPQPGQTVIPRNFGRAPGYHSINLRISKIFGFGQTASSQAAPPQQNGAAAAGQTGASQQSRTSQGARAGDRPYRLTISLLANNILNHTNAGSPVGNLSSSLFGQSTFLGTLGGTLMTGNGAASNRRLDFQVRLNF